MCKKYHTASINQAMGTPTSVPVGFRFHPTDEELVGHYLKHKLLCDDSNFHNIIAELDVCKFEPWDLPAFSKVKSDDPEWFFFSPLGLKYTNSNRCNRATKAGYWKVTGKDRKIKKRGTNNVIGTKKTLVFYKGRAPHSVKTNWVIHEYHAVTFPDDKRNFVLCRLMEKAEKKAERGTDAMIHDEGEPSSHIAADDENQATADRISDVYMSPEVESIFQAQPQAEKYDFTLVQQSLISIEQEPYSPGSTFPSVYFGNENSTMQFPFETTEREDNVDLFLNSILAEKDDFFTFPSVYFGNENSTMQFPFETTKEEDIVDLFLNSILAEKGDFFSEETTHAFVNDTTLSQPLRKVYHESSETDAELLSARYCKILDTTSSVCNEHTDSRENPVMSIVKSSHDALYAASPPVSSQNEVNLEKDSTVDDDARSSQAHRKVSNETVSQQEMQKEIHILKSNNEQRKARGTSSRKNVETTSDQSSVVNQNGSSIYLETPLSMNLLQYVCIPDTISRENPVISIVKSSHDEVYAGPPPLSSEMESTFAEDVRDLSICVDVVEAGLDSKSEKVSVRVHPEDGKVHINYHPRSHNFVSLRAAARSKLHRKVSSQEVSQEEVLKETHILESNKVQRKAQGTSLRKKVETTGNQSSGVKGKDSVIIYLETP